jgi:hypothetical protein
MSLAKRAGSTVEVEAEAAGWRRVIAHESAFQGEEGALEK